MAWADVQDEMDAGALSLQWSAIESLMVRGMPHWAIAQMTEAGAIGLARVCESGGRWVRDDGGQMRLLLAVLSPTCELIDIAAISSVEPDQWSLLTGDGVILGWPLLIEAVDEAGRNRAMESRAIVGLRLHGRPLDWLLSGMDGICVLDWGALALAELRGLGDGVSLVTDDAGAAARLRDALTWRDLPGVVSQDKLRRTAAA